ncbi:hypothetical protein Tco_1431391, partial [Tanacetum coccineum]
MVNLSTHTLIPSRRPPDTADTILATLAILSNLIGLEDLLDHSVEIPSGESKVHIEFLSVLWGNRLPIPNGSLPLS